MRGNSHVRFGRRAEETDWPKGRHRASARPDHFQATELIAAGVDVRTVAGRLGHADASTTLRIYAAFMEPADQGAARVIDCLLGSPSPPGSDPAMLDVDPES
jgi:integrase